ncbi:MAG: MoaD/ThiS family protein [Dehalococcoidia bacterium]|nr:MoaD/ThiS family protein [Dehalococcoidia bacterium]
MSVRVWLSGSLRQASEGKAEAEVVAKDIADCLDKLEIQFPGLKERLYDDKGELHRFIDIFVNRESVRSLQGLATPLKDGDEVSILPAFAGA